MWANIEDLRARAGLVAGDTSKDILLTAAADTALALAENYCDRKFPYQDDTEHFVHKDGHVISLRRYPLDAIKMVTEDSDSDLPDYHFDKENGLIKFDGHIHQHDLTMTYSGGYKDGEWPKELLLALALLFGKIWPEYSSSGGSTVQAGTIESVTVADVGTVRYATGAKAVAASGAGGDFLTPTVINILGNYRRELC